MNTRRSISLIAIILIVLTLASCQDVSAPEGMKEISTDAHAYNFYVYTQWIVDEQNNQCAYYSTADRSNVSMSAYVPDPSYTTVQEYYEACKAQYAEDFTDFTVVEESTDAKMFEYNAYKIVYTFSFGDEQFKVMQVLTLHHNLIYVYTYTATPENYDKHLESAEAMLAEITFDA